MIKRIGVIINLLLASFILAEDVNIVESGSLLFVQPTEPSTLFIDGKKIGTTPILLSNINSKINNIELIGENNYYKTKIKFNSGINSIKYFSPKLGPYFGYIKLNGFNSDGFKLYINDNLVKNLDTVKVTVGEHKLKAVKDGFYPFEANVSVQKLETVNVSIIPKKSIPITFNDAIPEESIIKFINIENSKSYIFTAKEEIVLYAGDWKIIVESKDFRTVEQDFNIADSPVELTLSFEKFQPKLKLTGLLADSNIILNDIDITDSIIDGQITAIIGENKLSIEKDDYFPIFTNFSLEGDQIYEFKADYIKDPAAIKKIALAKKKKGLIRAATFIGTGVALLAGGAITNSDDFLFSATSDYDTYKSMKYLTMGVTGAGAALSVVGSAIGFMSFTIPLDGE